MNPQRDSLSKALRELAGDAPQGASPELGASVRHAFARHHAIRRRKQAAVAAGITACLTISIAWAWLGRSDRPAETAKLPPSVTQRPSAPDAVLSKTGGVAASSALGTKSTARVHAKKKARAHGSTAQTPPPVTEAGDFVALPTFDPAIPLGQSRMVRLDLPGPALQLIGYPVDGQLLQRRVLTDVLVGQDGTPYAVRLVQTRNVR